ncbi:MAG: hypothetical protein LCI00_10060 [Chloroflexi bacterium]|nr:hypothetical protein [Chloroflexota bacterium]MCC6892930.1 hypothetical protein [Anaerolineae bacterium]
MGFSAEWYLADKILYARNWGKTTPESVRKQVDTLDQMLTDSAAGSIYVILDLTQVTKALNLRDFPKAFGSYKTNPKYGWMLMVGQKDPVVRFASGVATTLFKAKQRSFNTVTEAVDFLRNVDPDIDWSTVDPSVLTRPIPA